MSMDSNDDNDDWVPKALLSTLGLTAIFPSTNPAPRDINVTLHSLEDSLFKVAVVIERYGEDYIEIYEKIEFELKNHEARLSKVYEAKLLARTHTLDGESNLLEP